LKHYERTPRQDLAIGLQISEEARKQLDADGSDGTKRVEVVDEDN